MKISDPKLLADISLSTDAAPLFQPDGSLSLQVTDIVQVVLMVDTLREKNGLLPMWPTDRHMTDFDVDGWYNCYIDICASDADKTGSSILVVVDSPEASDNFDEYYINLSDDVRKALYQKLNAEFAERFGADFAELFAEARRYNKN